METQWKEKLQEEIKDLKQLVAYVKQLRIKIIVDSSLFSQAEDDLIVKWIYNMESKISSLELSILIDDFINQ